LILSNKSIILYAMKYCAYTLIFISFLISLLIAQDVDRNQQQNKLEQIRKEIDGYRRKVKREEQKEKQLLDAVAHLDREIDLTHQLLTELEKEEKRKGRQISKISRELDATRNELERLQQIYAKRIVNFYKYGRMKDIELLLSANSFNQTITWFKFQQLIAQNDRRNYLNISKKKEKIENQRNKLKEEVVSQRKIINEKRDEETLLKDKSKERNELLAKVQDNKQIFLQRLKEYELSMREIQRLINVEEDKRQTLEQEGIIQTTDFPTLKGRMIWPTRGKVINHFGRYQHAKWKTVILQNIGIDIQADFGQEVRATDKGIVTAITWQRGRGNIVMINHFGGYFTVYTHLSQIFVQVDEAVEVGQIIGSVGDSGSLSGPMLHFEIWKNKQPLNPEEWLI
jgi:septal ring factor EnvC (AmiA/AmiB activator)